MFIDGFDYLEDTRAQKFHSREDRMGHIAQDLVTMSIELNIPVIGVIQANRKGSAEDDIDTTNITGADKIGASCTRLIALKNQGTAIEMSLPKIDMAGTKLRCCISGKQTAHNTFYTFFRRYRR